MLAGIEHYIESALPPQAADLRHAWFSWKNHGDDTGLFYALECSPRSMGFRIGLLWLSLFKEPLAQNNHVKSGHWIRWLKYHLVRQQFSPPDRYYIPSNNGWAAWVYMAGWSLMDTHLSTRHRCFTARYLEHGQLSWYSLWRFSQEDPILYGECLGGASSPVGTQHYDYFSASLKGLSWTYQDAYFWESMDRAWVLFQSDEHVWRDWLLMQRQPKHPSVTMTDLPL